MADKYLKGMRVYHLVEEGAKVTKCGFKFATVGREDQLETTKSVGAWGNCPACTHAADYPEELKKKFPK